QISLRLAQLEEQASSIKQEQQALYAQWNATLTVCRLPPEIILEILTQYRRRTLHCTTAMNTEWVKLRLVCRYWNTVACAMPRLWREIDVDRHPSWFNLCLERSEGSTLTFSSTVSRASREEAVVPMISPHAQRLRQLVIDFGAYHHIVIPQLRVLNMHALEHLYVSQHERPDPTSDDLNLTHLRHPLLQTLNLHHSVLSDTQLISNLRVLHVVFCASNLSINQFITALAASQRLEDLKIHYFFKSLTGWDSLSAICQPPATLSRLTKLDVAEDSASPLPPFLTHLRLPANARIFL
ncbi:hypothetical protein C2E23DRAFT_704780, partial [Lenzites betulinus]